MHAYDAVFMLGPQGSGKGTQARLLAEKLGFFMWDTGAVLRENRGAVTVSGRTVGEIIDQGQLLTDDELLGVVSPLIAAIPLDKGVVFDGIPRRLGQAEYLTNFLKEKGRTRFVTILLDVPTEESVKRLLLRAEKEGRPDDTREAIEYRLAQYGSETVPMLEFLKKEGEFLLIDGRPSIPEVTQAIFKALQLD